MNAQPSPVSRPAQPAPSNTVLRVLAVFALLFVFMLGVNGLGDGFKALGGGLVESFIAATENPFMGLMVGILATTLVQSSSVSTSLIVGLVAAPDNPLPIVNAVPMIMGANIGTTVTNTLVSLGHIGRAEEFRRAFAVATCHDFFNFIAVAVFLPLEMLTGYLRKTAMALSSLLTGFGGVEYESPIKNLLKASLVPIKGAITLVFGGARAQTVTLILFSAGLIFLALYFLVRVMRSAMRSRVERLVSRGLGQTAVLAIIVGIVVTVMVQSSSITTSLLVPLAGAGILTLQQAFPITVGANIGTTVTAALAALAATGDNATAGITIALVHFLFNLSATLLIFTWQPIRRIPLIAAQRLADIAVRSRRYALLYVLLLFYGVPALFTVLNHLLQ